MGDGSGDGTSGRVTRVMYLDDATRDFGLDVAFALSVRCSDTWPIVAFGISILTRKAFIGPFEMSN